MAATVTMGFSTARDEQPVVRREDGAEVHRIDERAGRGDGIRLEIRELDGGACDFERLALIAAAREESELVGVGTELDRVAKQGFAAREDVEGVSLHFFPGPIAGQEIVAHGALVGGELDHGNHGPADAVQAEGRAPGVAGVHAKPRDDFVGTGIAGRLSWEDAARE